MSGLLLPSRDIVESYFVGVRADSSRREVQLTFRLREGDQVRLFARGVERPAGQ